MTELARPLCAALALPLALACAPGDRCAEVRGEPALALGAAGEDLAFEELPPGGPLELVLGPQGGMHVFVHARITGLCPDTTVIERRVIDDASGELYFYGRGPIDFVETEAPGTFEPSVPMLLILCPDPFGRPVADRRLRAVASARDDRGRSADAELAFVATCPAGVDCASICAP